MDTSKEINKKLADIGIAIFTLRLDCPKGLNVIHFIHDGKTIKEWREDICTFRGKSNRSWLSPSKSNNDKDPYTEKDVFNDLMEYLFDLGYRQIDNVVTDVYEGRIACLNAQLMNDSSFGSKDGFGVYGYGSQTSDSNKERPEDA